MEYQHKKSNPMCASQPWTLCLKHGAHCELDASLICSTGACWSTWPLCIWRFAVQVGQAQKQPKVHVQEQGPSSKNDAVLSQTQSQAVVAGRAVLERRAAAKAAAESLRKQNSVSVVGTGVQDDEPVNASKKTSTKAAKDVEKARRAAEKERVKSAKALEKEQMKRAKALESRARGAKANDEITVVLDNKLTLCAHKRVIVDALEAHDVKFRQELEPGKLPGWTAITWRRKNSCLVRPAARLHHSHQHGNIEWPRDGPVS